MPFLEPVFFNAAFVHVVTFPFADALLLAISSVATLWNMFWFILFCAIFISLCFVWQCIVFATHSSSLAITLVCRLCTSQYCIVYHCTIYILDSKKPVATGLNRFSAVLHFVSLLETGNHNVI